MSILLIFSFQTLYGYTYQWIGLLVAFFMVGLALGSYLMTRSIERIQSLYRSLIGVEALIILSCVLSRLLFGLLYSSPAGVFGFQGTRLGFLAISFLSGFWVGFEFPLSSRAITRNGKSVGRPAGILYASDLFGAWLGALLVGVIFVPILGIFQTCAAILLLKSASFVFLAKSVWRECAH
jgi:spermidine synthase